jgi:predicted phage tail protein
MKRDIYLHGILAQEFGEHYSLDCASTAEAARGLGVQLPGFMPTVRQHNFKIVIVGQQDDKWLLGQEHLNFNLGNCREVHFVPVVGGAGGDDGVGKIVAGVAIAAVAVAGAVYTGGASLSALGGTIGATGISYGQVAALGVSIALSGVSQALAPSPQGLGGQDRPEERPSFVFNRPVNTTEQGNPIPLVYGRFKVGSQVISSGISVEQLDVN